LEKAKSGLDAARQLNLQLEEKSRVISTLRSQRKSQFIFVHDFYSALV
jgi:hypothetical protein